MIYSNSDFAYSRKYFVKNLFNAVSVFAQFSRIEFFSFTAFYNFIAKNMFTLLPRNEYCVRVSSRSELIELLKIVRGTQITRNMITIKHGSSLNDDVIDLIADDKIQLSSNYETLKNIDESFSLYKNVPYWTEYTIDSSNYETTYNNLVKNCLAHPVLNRIDLQFDYYSFEEKPMSELHKLSFYMNLLKSWINGEELTSRSDVKEKPVHIELKTSTSPVRCLIDEKLDIYLDEKTKYFEMSKFIDYDGEKIDSGNLNIIRKLIDVKFNYNTTNWYLVDLAQNIKIMGDLYEIPYITKLITSLL